MNSILKLVVVFCVMTVPFIYSSAQPTPKAQDDDELVLPAQDPDSVSRRDFMRTKLMYAQNILEGLTTSGDFEYIVSAIEEIQRVTEAEQWIEVDNEQYRRLSREFKTATKRLMAAAKTGNIDATALRYYNMSTSCIDCHKHIRRAGYEF